VDSLMMSVLLSVIMYFQHYIRCMQPSLLHGMACSVAYTDRYVYYSICKSYTAYTLTDRYNYYNICNRDYNHQIPTTQYHHICHQGRRNKYQIPMMGIEPTTLGLLDPRSNQLSYIGLKQ
jgi:hypothetical protein